MTKAKKQEQEEARAQLREWCPPGTTIYTIVTHVARSGMSRRIRCFMMRGAADDMGPWDITGYVGLALGYRRNDRDGGLVIGGCGMDMGFHVVNSLSYALHGHETIGREAKEAGAKGGPHEPKPGNYRAGYSLVQRWL